MKKLTTGLIIAMTVYSLSACNSDRTTTADSTTTALNSDSVSVTDNMATNNSMSDTSINNMSANPTGMVDLGGADGSANFTTEAANGGMMEVEAAKVAQKKASSKDVKDLATMILNDHTKNNNDLKKIAAVKNLTLPAAMTAEHQSHIDMLRSKTGADFDKTYVDMMESDHQKDIEMFTNASNMLTDKELKSFAVKTLPVLKKHADKVNAIQAKM